MKVCENVYQIKVEFNVTKTIKRYVYCYLIMGKKCYFIDAGVNGCKKNLEVLLQKKGRKIQEVEAIFLTHAHPDHIGGASEIKEESNCKIYCSEIEKKWAEDIDLEFKERPIPNFYELVNKSVIVDKVVQDNDRLLLENGITLRVIGAAGHSFGSVSYLWEEKGVLFSGDAIPNLNELPILVDREKSRQTLERFRKEKNIHICCPAWDRVYAGAEVKEQMKASQKYLEKLETCIQKAKKIYGDNMENVAAAVCHELGFDVAMINPLFKRSI